MKYLRNYILNRNTYFSLILFTLYYSVKLGPKASIKMAIDYRWFDLWYKTDTSTTETTDEDYIVLINSENVKNAVHSTGDKLTRFYSAMSAIKSHLKYSNKKIKNLTFIDYGSGKGRVLILAKKYGFDEVAGVELSSSMIDIAKNNFSIVNEPDIKIVEEDAACYKIPEANGYVFYFYNPFGAEVLEKVIGNIESTTQRREQDAYIVYSNPIQNYLFDEKKYKLIYEKHKLKVFYLDYNG